MLETIYFYGVNNAYGFLSNFAPYPIERKGKQWPTSEHYFQAQKFPGTDREEEIRLTDSPMLAARMGRSRKHPLRPDWEKVKEEIMKEALRSKFTQHPELKQSLLATGEAILIEHTANDRYWGDGGDGTGLNRLGALLMEIRQELTESTKAQPKKPLFRFR
ncbi:NADAR family protein [Salinithrix halophila]|uniref:NADAR family protein n=1 Tax=Salinithrix halophila TaxID=1485204 RepID=A0ABV8JH45_9BACL